MKPRYLQPESGTRERWMVSYMDVLTILLIFFVALAAKSMVPPKSLAPAVARPEAHAGLQEVQQKLERQNLDVRMEQRGLVISLPQAILFRPGRDEVDAAALPVVDQIAEVLRRIPNKVSLVGHTDPVPIHNRRFRSNWELAAARGLRLLDLLATRFGIPEARLSTASYGATEPRSSNDTPDGRASNRRVEIVILDTGP
jgi:chemotaxis protein MotB